MCAISLRSQLMRFIGSPLRTLDESFAFKTSFRGCRETSCSPILQNVRLVSIYVLEIFVHLL